MRDKFAFRSAVGLEKSMGDVRVIRREKSVLSNLGYYLSVFSTRREYMALCEEKPKDLPARIKMQDCEAQDISRREKCI